MWISVNKAENKPLENVIIVPKQISEQIGDQVTIHHGLCKELVKIVTSPTDTSLLLNSFEHPIDMKCSPHLMEALLLQEEITYQMKIIDHQLYIGPIIGMLLGEQQYYYHDRYMNELLEALSVYKEIGGLIIAFKQCSINWKEKFIQGLYYYYPKNEWRYGKLPFPAVVYRRAYKTTEEDLKELKKITSGNVFNSTRFNKWELFDTLKDHPTFKRYLPPTAQLKDGEIVNEFIKRYKDVIIKPSDLSRARGICIIKTKTKDLLDLHDYNNGKNAFHKTIERWNLAGYLRKNGFFKRNYIVQSYINLAKINGSPWDIRIVMHKNEKLKWECTGIECRVAGDKQFVTNISKGGKAMYFNQSVRLAYGPHVHPTMLKKQVIKTAKEFCGIMDHTGEHFAEFGIDLALDEEQNIWFIEANIRPTFNGFRTMDRKTYEHICFSPIRYAAARAGFGGKE
jgi:glutathione synthase/RimK-type ligase-like ATP-grasp enzyme